MADRVVEKLNLLLDHICRTPARPHGFVLQDGAREAGLFKRDRAWVVGEELSSDILTRLKIMSGMDPEVNGPQVGYIRFNFGGGDVSLIIQTRPTPIGEEIMVRLTTIDDPTFPP